MARYTVLRSRSWYTPWPWDEPRLPALTVTDDPAPVDTGLLDQHGNRLGREREVMGFGVPRRKSND